MVAAVNQFTLQRRLFGPARLLEAAIERRRVIAAVAGGLGEGFARLDGREVVGHLMRGDQIAAADVEPIEAEVAGREVEEPFHKEAALEPARTPIGAGRPPGGD